MNITLETLLNLKQLYKRQVENGICMSTTFLDFVNIHLAINLTDVLIQQYQHKSHQLIQNASQAIDASIIDVQAQVSQIVGSHADQLKFTKINNRVRKLCQAALTTDSQNQRQWNASMHQFADDLILAIDQQIINLI